MGHLSPDFPPMQPVTEAEQKDEVRGCFESEEWQQPNQLKPQASISGKRQVTLGGSVPATFVPLQDPATREPRGYGMQARSFHSGAMLTGSKS